MHDRQDITETNLKPALLEGHMTSSSSLVLLVLSRPSCSLSSFLFFSFSPSSLVLLLLSRPSPSSKVLLLLHSRCSPPPPPAYEPWSSWCLYVFLWFSRHHPDLLPGGSGLGVLPVPGPAGGGPGAEEPAGPAGWVPGFWWCHTSHLLWRHTVWSGGQIMCKKLKNIYIYILRKIYMLIN